MNLYISNFKSFLYSIVFTKIVLISLVYFVIDFYLDLKTNRNQFIEYMKESKSRHMLYNYKFKNYDMIFIGSSKTQYHISKSIFKEQDINIYNYGVSGHFFYDYPYMVEKSTLLNPKEIIISIPLWYLYHGDVADNAFKGILFEDFKYIVRTHSYKVSIAAFLELIKNLYLPFLYAQNINSRINKIYKKFNININDNNHLKNNKDNYQEIQELKILRSHIDCAPFLDKKTIINCLNGDGILFGNLKTEIDKKKTIYLKNNELNIDKINLLNLLNHKLEKKDIKLTLIFEPLRNNLYKFDKNFLKNKLNFKILNANTFSTKNTYWRDNGHFNSEGRKFYSEFLLNHLTNH